MKIQLRQFCFGLLIAIGAVFIVNNAAHAYDKPYIGEDKNYSAKYVDTFVHLARDYNLGFVEIRAANPGIDPWIPGEGTKLVLPLRHLLPEGPREGIIINIAEMRLYYFEKEDEAPISVPIGVGREGLDTPLGTTTVVRKTEGPHWYPTQRMRDEDPELPAVVKPGPENPLGTHAIYLGWPTYAIHGTNRPFGIGRRISSGCIRLYPEDIKQIFAKVPVGTKVTVVDQPVKTAWIDDKLYIEAHPDRDQAIEIEDLGTITSARLRKEDIQIILEAAGEHAAKLDWDEVYKILRERKGYGINVLSRSSDMVSTPDQSGKVVKTSADEPQMGPNIPIKQQVAQIYKTLHEKEIAEKKRAEARDNPEVEEPKTASYEDEQPSSSFRNLNP